jgi:hypothetical protein
VSTRVKQVHTPDERATARSQTSAEAKAPWSTGLFRFQHVAGNQAVAQLLRPDSQRAIGNQFLRSLVSGYRLQAKLTISQSNDISEREADQIADQVMRVSGPIGQRCACGGVCHDCAVRRNAAGATVEAHAPPIVHDVLRSTGEPLELGARAFMEPRFAADLRGVRIHRDTEAAASAAAVNALAYAVGHDVVFGRGQYQPTTSYGRRLLAHELVHVLQQTESTPHRAFPNPGAAWLSPASAVSRGGVHRVARAQFRVGATTVTVDYGNVAGVPVGDVVQTIEAMYTAWTGGPVSDIHAAVVALTSAQQRWLMFALDLVIDNTPAPLAGLDRRQAVNRLIGRAPLSPVQPSDPRPEVFERDVLSSAGWFETALTVGLTPPSAAVRAALGPLYNPPSVMGGPVGPLDAAQLQTALPPALEALLLTNDPAGWPATGAAPLSDLQTVADVIQTEARSFFSPYADTRIDNPSIVSWQYGAHLISVTASAPTHTQRIQYLLNRAEVVGRDTSGGSSIFDDANVDLSRPGDRAALLGIVTTMEADPTIQARTDRLIQHTGRTVISPLEVGVSTEFNAATSTDCQVRWQRIRTLSHELCHALVHPNFFARATSVGFSQVIREGFTEVLGMQLYRHLRARAAADVVLKGRLEAGLGAACPAPPLGTLGYRDAGRNAEDVRTRIGDQNFRAAYFLGATSLAGL